MLTPRANRPNLTQLRELNSPTASPTLRTPVPSSDQDTVASTPIPISTQVSILEEPQEDITSTDFDPERLDFPSITSPPLLDSVSVLSVTPAVPVPVVSVENALIRQVAVPIIPLLQSTASKSLIAQWIALVTDPDMNYSHLLYLSLDMKALVLGVMLWVVITHVLVLLRVN